MDAAATVHVTPEEAVFKEAALWVEAHREAIPASVYTVVTLVIALRSELERAKARAGKLLELFRKELGITPKSERGSSPSVRAAGKTDAERLAALKTRRAKLHKQIRRYEERLDLARRQKRASRSALTGEKASPPAVEDDFKKSDETLFSGSLATHQSEKSKLSVDRVDNFENPRGLHSASDKRTRHEYGVFTKTITLEVETVTDLRTGKSVTASTDEIGPPNSQATWAAIANTIIAVIGYAIPVNRLASMLKESCPYFTSSRLCFYLKMAAEMFSPIYTCLGEELADADWLQGDDTKARVIEINTSLKETGELKAVEADSLIGRVADAFGRIFPKKRGKGKKRAVNVSVVIGKTKAYDPRSFIFFFRTHVGSLGDLLTKLLEMRSPKKKALTIVSDLATTNLVRDDFYQKFDITHAGCGPHARRPFWRHKEKDHGLCYWMLSAFLVLENIEDKIDELGRTKERILRYRQRYGAKVWQAILRRCETVVAGQTTYGSYWPKTSELYKACQYIISHYAELTRYLSDPRLPSNNNLSERVLRWDKIMEDASKFRLTEAGRLHVDILRTIVHTCSAAEVDLKDYLLFVFKNRAAIEDKPEKFTPYAFAQGLQEKARHASEGITNERQSSKDSRHLRATSNRPHASAPG